MARFSVGDAALTGFRIVRAHPKAFAIWAVLQFIFSLGSALAVVSLIGPALAGVTAGQGRDPAAALAMFRNLGPFYLAILFAVLIITPIVNGAMNRAVLRPSDEGFGYIRLGEDELRQFGLILLGIGVGLVAYVILLLAVVAAVMVPALMTARSVGGGTVWSVLLSVILGFFVVGLWIYVWVRLSLAPALTFATRKINLFGSWKLTKGLFWPMFGAYTVAFILVIVIQLTTAVVSLSLTTAGGGLAGLTHPDLASAMNVFAPMRLISLAISAISSALVLPLIMTPPAAIYKSLPGSVSEIEAASVFD
jgi:hypothetical protein